MKHLAALYAFVPLDVSAVVYPYNIYLSHQHSATIIEQYDPKLRLIIVQDERHEACLATVKTYDTGTTLYYLPVKPLYDLIRKGRKKEAKLLLSVFAYLFQVVCIPYYTFDNAFVQCNYEMIGTWLVEDPDGWDREEYQSCLSEVKAANYYGNKLLKQIRHGYHLQQFEQRVTDFVPDTAISAQLWECSRKILQLYKSYPARAFYDSIQDGLLAPKDEEQRMTPEHYLSFIWSDGGWLFEQLLEQVNSVLQEFTEIAEPVSLQYFDAPQQSVTHDLTFETELFTLLDELAYIINRIA